MHDFLLTLYHFCLCPRKTDTGTLRHVRIVHRQGASSGLISPSQIIAPPEILALKKGQISTISLGIAFGSATDKDGVCVAKFDVKSDRGTTPIEIRPSLGEFLDPKKTSISQQDFDKTVDEMNGIHQRATATFLLSPVNKTAHQDIPRKVLQNFNLVSLLSNRILTHLYRQLLQTVFNSQLFRNKLVIGQIMAASSVLYLLVASPCMLLLGAMP